LSPFSPPPDCAFERKHQENTKKVKVDHSQPPIKSFFQASTSQRFASYDATQKALTKALLKTIACDQLPLSIVDSQAFRNLHTNSYSANGRSDET